MSSSGSISEFLVVGGMLAVSPGPNMMYVMSCSIAQGRTAGLVSLMGVMLGYLLYMFGAAFGITAFVLKVPYSRSTLAIGGALYLCYLAWQVVKPGGRSPLEGQAQPHKKLHKVFSMGAATSLLNPKLMMIFFSLLPQFINHEGGNILRQSLVLGSTLITVFASVNLLVAICAGGLSNIITTRPKLLFAQRMVMGAILATLGTRMVMDVLPL